MEKKAAFVYVVCGEDKHINTLNKSLLFLKKFSKKDIIVITDLSRNNINIDNDTIIDIKTDQSLNHHQASIFLKTSIHRYLNIGDNLYCYLDSDVLAISKDVDLIFKEYFNIIGFCPDNITLDYFSPYAINCDCIELYGRNKNNLVRAIDEYNKLHQKWETDCSTPEGIYLQNRLNEIKSKKLKNIIPILLYSLQNSIPLFKRNKLESFLQNKSNKSWYNKKGEIVLYPIDSYESFVSKNTGFAYNFGSQFWTMPNSQYDVTKPRCSHLHKAIKETFSIDILQENWQHPNGGVFLFDKTSVDFLEQWHQKTLKIFAKNDWKTRDQGTLATTFWEFGLNERPLLSKEFNYIIDRYCDSVSFDLNRGFSKDNYKTIDTPKMVHIFHYFGDTNWDVWNQVESILFSNYDHLFSKTKFPITNESIPLL